MKIAIVGAGRIGSTFALHLARAGHEVTVIARGERLAWLKREQAIVTVDGERVAVTTGDALDVTVPYDLVLVMVLRHQLDALMPALQASPAKTVLFMFNAFDDHAVWRQQLGAGRFAMGFPRMVAHFVDGKLRSQVAGPGNVTTLDNAQWAALLKEAGMPTALEPDMQSFSRSHVAFVLPMFIAAMLTWKRDHGLTWSEASKLSAVMAENFDVVRALGTPIKKGMYSTLAKLPRLLVTATLWAFARTAALKDMGEFGPGETRELIDVVAASAPGRSPKLLAMRP